MLEMNTARILPAVEYRGMLHQYVLRHAAVSAGLLKVEPPAWSDQNGNGTIHHPN